MTFSSRIQSSASAGRLSRSFLHLPAFPYYNVHAATRIGIVSCTRRLSVHNLVESWAMLSDTLASRAPDAAQAGKMDLRDLLET